jgi:hypothetical protein
MKGRKLLPYLLILLIVGGGFVFSEYYQSRQLAQEKEAKKVFHLQEKDLVSLTLKEDKGTILLQKKGADWEIVQPITSRTDSFTLTSLFSSLTGLEKQRELPVAPDKLKDFGLDKPAFTLEIKEGEKTRQLKIGQKTPGDRSFYAQLDQDNHIFLINAADKEALDRDLTALRDKAIFTLSPEKVTEVILQTPKSEMALKKTNSSHWIITGQPQTKIRSDRVETLLRQLTMAKALAFVAEKPTDLKKYGLEPAPAARLTLSQEKQTETLLLGGRQQERYYAQKKGVTPVFLVDKDLYLKMPVSPGQLEDRRLWSGKEDEVRKITWGSPDKRFEAVKEKEAWKITAPDGKEQEVPEFRLGLALAKLKEIDYSRLLAPNSPVSGTAKFSLQLKGSEDKLLFTLEEFPSSTSGQVQVKAVQGDETTIALIPDQAIPAWQAEIDKLMLVARRRP